MNLVKVIAVLHCIKAVIQKNYNQMSVKRVGLNSIKKKQHNCVLLVVTFDFIMGLIAVRESTWTLHLKTILEIKRRFQIDFNFKRIPENYNNNTFYSLNWIHLPTKENHFKHALCVRVYCVNGASLNIRVWRLMNMRVCCICLKYLAYECLPSFWPFKKMKWYSA